MKSLMLVMMTMRVMRVIKECQVMMVLGCSLLIGSLPLTLASLAAACRSKLNSPSDGQNMIVLS